MNDLEIETEKRTVWEGAPGWVGTKGLGEIGRERETEGLEVLSRRRDCCRQWRTLPEDEYLQG